MGTYLNWNQIHKRGRLYNMRIYCIADTWVDVLCELIRSKEWLPYILSRCLGFTQNEFWDSATKFQLQLFFIYHFPQSPSLNIQGLYYIFSKIRGDIHSSLLLFKVQMEKFSLMF